MILFDFAVAYWFCCYDELRCKRKIEKIWAGYRGTRAINTGCWWNVGSGVRSAAPPRAAARGGMMMCLVLIDDVCAFVLLLICVMFTN